MCTDLTKDDDGAPTSDLLMERIGKDIEIIIPPQITAVLSPKAARDPTPRDKHIAQIAQRRRMGWQVSSGYNQRSRIEAPIGRWKMLVGPQMRARKFENQETEVKITTHIMNKMNELGRAKLELIA